MVGGLSFLLTATVLAQQDPGGGAAPGDPDAPVTLKVGGVHEDLRRATRRHRRQAGQDDLYGDYSRRKMRIQEETGIQWSLDLSLLQQWGGPNGGSPALQFLAGLSLSSDLFHDETLGVGAIQFSGNIAAYVTVQTGADIGSSLGVISAINDWPVSQRDFEQLTYTQALPGDRLSLSIGQFPFANFDGNRYLGNQQHNFVNYVFTQNGSATYAAAGLGAYAQWSPTKTIQVALGLQYPNDASAATLSFPGLGEGERSWLAYAQWTPSLPALGSAEYSLTYYQSPATGQQPATQGWSLNAVQDLDETWALFGRANSASGFTTAVGASYALGLAMNDPLRRSPTDQIGLAIGYSGPGSSAGARRGGGGEGIIETYWSWTLFGGVLLTTDAQLYVEPVLDSERNSGWVLSLRTTLPL